MIIFLYGKDGYRLKQNLDKIISEYKNKHASGMSFSNLDISESSQKEQLGNIEDLIKTVSFFGEKRLIVIRSPFLIGGELSMLIKKWGLAEDKDRIIVLIENQTEPELKKKDKNLYSLLSTKPNMVRNFEPLVGRQLESWVTKEIVNLGNKIEPSTAKQLISYVGNDSWSLSQEIAKLVNFKNADGSPIITAADLDLLVRPKIDGNVFTVIDAISGKNQLRATKLLHNHIESGVDPYYIFSMIVYQFRNLLRVKGLAAQAVPYAGIIKKTGLNPFVVKKSYEQCRHYELDELKRRFTDLFVAEIDMKKGELEIEDFLYKFVFSL